MADVGSLSIDATSVVQGAPIVFTYSVPADHASDTNWIGIWAADGGGAPVDGEYVASQITYQYSPGTSGSVTISSGLLPPGTEYVAYYLYNDGYTSLADAGPVHRQRGQAAASSSVPRRLREARSDPARLPGGDDARRAGPVLGGRHREPRRPRLQPPRSRGGRHRSGCPPGAGGCGGLRRPRVRRRRRPQHRHRLRRSRPARRGDRSGRRRAAPGGDRRRQRPAARRRRRQQPGRGLRPEERSADHVDHRRDPHPLRLLRGGEPHLGGVVQPPVRR